MLFHTGSPALHLLPLRHFLVLVPCALYLSQLMDGPPKLTLKKKKKCLSQIAKVRSLKHVGLMQPGLHMTAFIQSETVLSL